MARKQTQKVFHLNTIIDRHLIAGSVTFSPAPQPGIFTELARFEAERLLAHVLQEAINSGQM